MASSSPLRPIAITRPMRSPQPIQLTVAGRPGNGATRQGFVDVAHVRSSPLVNRLLQRVVGFGQHLAALGGRHEIAAPTLSLDVRQRRRRAPIWDVTERRVARWPWGFAPSVAIPMRHEQFIGRAVLPHSDPQIDSGFDWSPTWDADDGETASLEAPQLDVPGVAPFPTLGLAGVRPFVGRSVESTSMLSAQQLANRIVADHVAAEATTAEAVARRITRSEQRVLALPPTVHGDIQRQPLAAPTASGLGPRSADGPYRQDRESSFVAPNAPTNFALELLRHVNWSPAYERQQRILATNVTVDRPVASLHRQVQGVPGPFGEPTSVWSTASPTGWTGESLFVRPGESRDEPVFRTMQVPPVARPLVPSLPPSTVAAPALPLVWRTFEGTATPGVPFAPTDTAPVVQSLVSPFVADRLAGVSRLLSTDRLAPGQSTIAAAGTSGTASTAAGVTPSAMVSPLLPADEMMPELPVVARGSAFGVARAQQILAGPISPVWGALGWQVQGAPVGTTPALPSSQAMVVSSPVASSSVIARRSAHAPSPGIPLTLSSSRMLSPAAPAAPMMGWVPGMTSSRAIPTTQMAWAPRVPSAHAHEQGDMRSSPSAPSGLGSDDVTLPLAREGLGSDPFVPPLARVVSRSAEVASPFATNPFFRTSVPDPATSSPFVRGPLVNRRLFVDRGAPVQAGVPTYRDPFGDRGPLVYRSPLVDRPEPDEMQRAEAGDLMAGSTGAPLPTVIRRAMEQSLGMDLAAVRVHTGPGVMRAANLISARSMARGTDVFMPDGVPESQTSPDLPLLAHELTHVAHHQGHQLPTRAIAQRAPMTGAMPMPVRPLTLARRTSDQEQQANQIERSFLDAARGLGQSAIPESVRNTALTLPKRVASGVQQAKDAVAGVAEPVTSAVSTVTSAISDGAAALAGPAAPSAAELADQVYHLLERRLIVERERGGYRR